MALLQKLRPHAAVLIAALITLVLLLLPTGYEGAVIYQGADRVAARVIAVNNESIIDTGLIRSGEQTCTVELLGGRFRGWVVEGVNMLNGSLEADKIFEAGDKAQVYVSYQGDSILSVNMVDHYRLDVELILALCFAALLLLFAGKTGLRAVLSFVLTVLMIWKALVPTYLKGFDPVVTGMLVAILLTFLIIALVYGFDRRCLAAVTGAGAGLVITCLCGILCTGAFKIHGAVMSNSESLLYSGYQSLNLTRIFMASIFIGSSGAVMDLSVDITSAVYEVVQKKPDIPWKEAVKSGFNVGRAAMGTMSTTLLLAYSGSCIALLMVFMAQGTPIESILNYKYVASEIVHTIVGSFGLVTVAPLTALASGYLLTHGKRENAPLAPSVESAQQQ